MKFEVLLLSLPLVILAGSYSLANDERLNDKANSPVMVQPIPKSELILMEKATELPSEDAPKISAKDLEGLKLRRVDPKSLEPHKSSNNAQIQTGQYIDGQVNTNSALRELEFKAPELAKIVDRAHLELAHMIDAKNPKEQDKLNTYLEEISQVFLSMNDKNLKNEMFFVRNIVDTYYEFGIRLAPKTEEERTKQGYGQLGFVLTWLDALKSDIDKGKARADRLSRDLELNRYNRTLRHAELNPDIDSDAKGHIDDFRKSMTLVFNPDPLERFYIKKFVDSESFKSRSSYLEEYQKTDGESVTLQRYGNVLSRWFSRMTTDQIQNLYKKNCVPDSDSGPKPINYNPAPVRTKSGCAFIENELRNRNAVAY